MSVVRRGWFIPAPGKQGRMDHLSLCFVCGAVVLDASEDGQSTWQKHMDWHSPEQPHIRQESNPMSVWASICGQDPVIYDGGYGDEILPDGWIDVAMSCIDSRVRIIIQDDEGSSKISLDPAGLAELHRRIVIAREQITR